MPIEDLMRSHSRTTCWSARMMAAVALAGLLLPGLARSQSHVRGWGQVVYDSRWHAEAFTEVAVGFGHTLARRADGSVVAWGGNFHGVCNVPVLPPGLSYVQVSGGYAHSLGLRSDGSVVVWGWGNFGQYNVPQLPP